MAHVSTSFLSVAWYYLVIWLPHILLIHLSVEGQWSCPHLWAVVSDAAVNVCAHVFMRTDVSSTLGETPRRGVAGSRGNSV